MLTSPAVLLFVPRRDHCVGGRKAREQGAVRGGEVVARARLAGKEQALINRRGEHSAAVGLTWQSERVGAAREGVAAPAMQRDRRDAGRKRVAEQTDQFSARKFEESRLSAQLQIGRVAAAEIALDQRSSERAQVIGRGGGAVGATKQTAVGRDSRAARD